MVFTKLLLGNALAIRPCNCEAVLEPLLPKVARCVPVLPSRYIGKCAARVLKRSEYTNKSARKAQSIWLLEMRVIIVYKNLLPLEVEIAFYLIHFGLYEVLTNSPHILLLPWKHTLHICCRILFISLKKRIK